MYLPAGFQVDILRQLADDVNHLQDREKWVIVIFDEMKIKEDLVYDKESGTLVGFCNLQGASAELKESEDIHPKKKLATQMLTFLVRSVCGNLELPYAHFPTRSVTNKQLYTLNWEVISHLEGIGLSIF